MLIAIWYYQTAVKHKIEKPIGWVVIGAASFFLVQLMLIKMNMLLVESTLNSQAIELAQTDINAGKPINIAHYSSGTRGILVSSYLEFMPALIGLLVCAFIRTMLMLKQPLTFNNLTSGFMDMLKGFLAEIKRAIKSENV